MQSDPRGALSRGVPLRHRLSLLCTPRYTTLSSRSATGAVRSYYYYYYTSYAHVRLRAPLLLQALISCFHTYFFFFLMTNHFSAILDFLYLRVVFYFSVSRTVAAAQSARNPRIRGDGRFFSSPINLKQFSMVDIKQKTKKKESVGRWDRRHFLEKNHTSSSFSVIYCFKIK